MHTRYTSALSIMTSAMLVLSFAFSSNTQAAITFQTVVMTDQAAPGTDPDVVFSRLFNATINDAGQLLIRGELSGPSIPAGTYSAGLWLASQDGIELVIQTGDPATGAEPGTYFTSVGGKINNMGDFLLGGQTYGPLSNGQGLWRLANNNIELLLQIGDIAPGTGSEFNTIRGTSFNASGQTTILASLIGAGVNADNSMGVWYGEPGALNMVSRSGDPVVDSATHALFYLTYEQQNVSLNTNGQAAILGILTGNGVYPSNDTAIWAGNSGAFSMIAREGTHAPGTAPDEYYYIFTKPVIHDTGDVVFRAVLAGPDVDDLNKWGLWAQRSDELSLIARGGQPAPGTEAGVRFFDFSNPAINSNGDCVFTARLHGDSVDQTNNGSIWIDRGDAPQLLIRTGQPAPGFEPGVVFRGDFTSSLLLNDVGQVAFGALLNGPGITELNDGGLWVINSTGTLQLIVREDDLFDVNDDPFIEEYKTIDSFAFLSASDTGNNGQSPSFNNAGQLAFTLTFTDGTSGIFVANTRPSGDFNGDGFVVASTIWTSS